MDRIAPHNRANHSPPTVKTWIATSTSKITSSYYANFTQPPRFAVLLNGPWGIGKTFLLKAFLESIVTGGKSCVYVSLYGLTSLDEIDDALLRAMYPLLDNKGLQIAGRLVKSVGKYFRVDLDLNAKDILNKNNADMFVFDDLERCGIPVSRVLGYINEFVEHEGRKVIIVANESEIKEDEDYRRIREKVIGKTLEIQSVFEQALDAFTASVQDRRTKDFLVSKADEVSRIYHASELHNLRVLQQTIWDFERFYMVLAEKHRENDAAMTAMLGLLFVLSFELKAGRLTVNDLKKRHSAILGSLVRSHREEGAAPPLAAAQKRYPEADLDDTTLSDETLIDLLVKGIIAEENIRAELDISSYFVTVADEPAWRTVWYAFERAEAEFDGALNEMERAFVAREFERTGEILHVFGLRLWLSDIGALKKTRSEAVEEGKRYIDDLYAQGRIEPTSPNEPFSELSFSGYAGLGIHENETTKYRELYAHLDEKRHKAELDERPDIAEKLLQDMVDDPNRFFRRVNLINGEVNEYYSIPILSALDPKEFVGTLLAQHPASQRIVFLALQGRYQHGHLDRDLAPERPWANEVRKRLLAAAKTMSPVSRYRVRQSVKHSLDAALGLPGEAGGDSIGNQ